MAVICGWRNRWYEPHTGRFLSEDPIGLEGGINPYAFAIADPVNFSDPHGTSAGSCPPGWKEATDTREAPDGTEVKVTVCRPPGGWTDVGEEAEEACRDAFLAWTGTIALELVGARSLWAAGRSVAALFRARRALVGFTGGDDLGIASRAAWRGLAGAAYGYVSGPTGEVVGTTFALTTTGLSGEGFDVWDGIGLVPLPGFGAAAGAANVWQTCWCK